MGFILLTKQINCNKIPNVLYYSLGLNLEFNVLSENSVHYLHITNRFLIFYGEGCLLLIICCLRQRVSYPDRNSGIEGGLMILCLDMVCTTSRSKLSRQKPRDRGRFNDIMFRYGVYYIKEYAIQIVTLR